MPPPLPLPVCASPKHPTNTPILFLHNSETHIGRRASNPFGVHALLCVRLSDLASVRGLTRTQNGNTLATTNGKGTTPKAKYISLAKAIALAEREPLHKWIDAYREFVRSGATSKLEWAEEMERSVKGTEWDTHPAGTIRVNLSHIEWAEENIIGGAKACRSLNHIVKSKSSGKTKPVSKGVEVASALTLTRSQVSSRLAKAGYPKALRDEIIKALGLR